MKQNKTTNYDSHNGNVITDINDSIKVILFNTFRESQASSEKLKTNKVNPIFKKESKRKKSKTTNQFLFLWFFFQSLGHFIYSCLYE